MKSRFIKIVKLILIIGIILCFYKIVEIKKHEYINKKRVLEIYSENKVSNVDEYEQYIESNDVELDSRLIDTLKINLSIIPKDILDDFFKVHNGKVILTNENLKNRYGKDDVSNPIIGLYDGNEKIVYINADKNIINDATIHEFGHVLDSLTGWTTINNKEVVSKIYNDEKDLFKTNSVDEHYKKNEREYIAQSFMEYILDKERLKQNTPKTYEYIEYLLKKVSE